MATSKRMILSFALASALMATTPVMANVKTKEVHHADLDLSSAQGRARLETRIRQAVKHICGSPRGMTIAERDDQRKCEKAAYAKAAPASERVVAAYMEKRGLAFDRRASVATN